MELRAKMRGWFQRPSAYLGGEWNRMAPRERKMVAGLGAAFVVAVVVVSWLFLVASLKEIDESNDDARQALAAIAKYRDEYLKNKEQMVAQEVRIGNDPPQLAADLESAARDAGIQIRETNPQPTVAAGKRYTEHRVIVTLRQVDLLALTKFLAKLETGRHFIMVTQMKIQRRYAEGDKLDVDLTATAFERNKEDRPTKKRAAPKEKT